VNLLTGIEGKWPV